MFSTVLKKIFGSQNDRFLRKLRPLVREINELEKSIQELSDDEMRGRIIELRTEIENGRELKSARPEVFALVREASNRVLHMRHFDVQLIGGAVLDSGRIAEMRTGEGKTLVATLPVVLNALSGKGVHVVTVNDYLARRDAEWMGEIYRFLGLSVGTIVHDMSDEDRKAAYASDITYGTNHEFGFDYLRDNMKFYKNQLVQRGHNYAIVDEVDSILIDEARTPLIISGPSEDSTTLYRQVDAIIPKLEKDADFTVDEKARTVTLTDDGVTRCEELLNIDNLYDPRNTTYQHHVLQALKAHELFRNDVNYLVKDGEVVIVDEFTGRTMPGRRFSDGLHQALEAKERVKIQAENQTLASITFQNYFRLYDKLAGMTGTADTEAVEFHQIYNLEVISIPTHQPMVCVDSPDLIYRTKQEKFAAIAKAIKELHEKGQPVLVGTISIENSELISGMLKKNHVPHNVLNAKNHEQEALIVAEAGCKGKVTIATNMAGRGTDIKLGEGVRELGGLHIIGTERQESRRIDNQLRGRSGRQGDPGSSRFYLSLEDDLLRIFGSERFSGILAKLGMNDGQPIEDRLVSRAIEHAQKRVEAHHFEIRKTLLDYDNVMNQQREVIYTLRRDAINDDSEAIVDEFVRDVLDGIYAPVGDAKNELDDETKELAIAQLKDIFFLQRFWEDETTLPTREEAEAGIAGILGALKQQADSVYPEILRYFLLEELDRCWKEHLVAMDHLRDGIGLRGYGQKDPKQEYKKEGFAMFQDMVYRIRENVCRALTHLRLKPVDENGNPLDAPDKQAPDKIQAAPEPKLALEHKPVPSKLYYSGPKGQEHAKNKPHRATQKVGRNDECPCGSGKKYKKCCGAA